MTTHYQSIIRHYEDCLAEFGDSHRGVDWPNARDAAKRYQVMLDLIRPGSTPATLLDFGCGASHLYQYMLEQDVPGLRYAGLDASSAFYELSKRKYPHNDYFCVDVLAEPERLGEFDYIVMNGVFTEKRTLSFDDMFDYLQRMLTLVFSKAHRGIAFNVMSKQVDWERDDLFHMPIGTLTDFIVKTLSRHYVVRNDYGLYEYTVYVYKEHN
ncbi:class I SAM-dependent methyltransferase [Burkholderia glumae]|uniref:class I SAM-dependent methyltransferase n=1 Tax=Burkholderia glumae TaxID=337 RepID=UPI000F6023B5|nr:class I SAM-dependent methyltransferase [Burkholderia glumae]MCQ0033144.1 class I SAM-dependent methyltransferase [Burkholderia glumae]MCQ0037713.1 class I SAM-dependent methyltransferase [Burkholderia glumae]QJW78965.1 class I SAM-dependent methyltransferase [Burkholderia glumae]RQZ66182.1 class I SAM-dependent methyltransferase [Burkholderia glumae]UVS82970.1 class I SAM-dependent methyltransferase [Burkholderia glumae]